MNNTLSFLQPTPQPGVVGAPGPLVTVFRTTNGKVAGKTFFRLPDGTPDKKSHGISQAIGQVHRVETIQDMANLLRQVTDDPTACIMMGAIGGTEDGEPFRLYPAEQYRGMLKAHGLPDNTPSFFDPMTGKRYAARVKRNIIPSTWAVIDRDMVEGMPPELTNMTRAEWEAGMDRLAPGFAQAAKIYLASSSGRVLDRGVPKEVHNAHYFVQVDDGRDLERWGSAMLINSFTCGLGFQRPFYSRETGEEISQRDWTIFDPTTFTREKLFYEGAPVAVSEGLEVIPATIEVFDGSRLDTHRVISPVGEVAGMRLRTKRDGGAYVEVNASGYLEADTVIETKDHGPMTVAQYAASGFGKLRCQAFNRPDSTSWNGYLSRHEDGSVFFFDNGTRMKLVYMDIARIFAGVPTGAAVGAVGGGEAGDPAPQRTLAEVLEQVTSDYLQFVEQGQSPEEALGCVIAEFGAKDYDPLITDRVAKGLVELSGVGRSAINAQIKQARESARAAREGGGARGREPPPPHPLLAEETIAQIGHGNLLYAQSWLWRWSLPQAGVWNKVDDETVKRVVMAVCDVRLERNYTSSVIDSILDLMKTLLHQEGDPFSLDGKVVDGINVANGELYRVDGQWVLHPHNREHRFVAQLPVAYDPAATAPRFEQFLSEIFAPDDPADAAQKRQLVLEAIGYTLLRTCRLEAFFLLIGKGSNGKSVLLRVIEMMLGSANVCAVQPSNFDNRFQRAHLLGKLANIVTEISAGSQIADAELKAIVSGELTTAENKNKPPFDFHPVATMWFGTNHMPHTRDFSDALFRRARILRFNASFPEGSPSRDEKLPDKLRLELPGILNLALAALAGALDRGGFTYCPSDQMERKAWRKSADQVEQFVEDRCVADPEAEVASGVIYSAYKAWAFTEGISKTLTHQSFGDRVVNMGFGRKRTKHARMITGIRVLHEYQTLGAPGGLAPSATNEDHKLA